MILFLQDWKKYPGAILQENTTNEEWLYMADVFQAMGITNYYWHLALHNPKLLHLDPFSKDLTLLQKAWIVEEVEANPWYFFREIARSKEGEKLRANRGNLAVWWLALTHTDYYLIQIRQTGKTNTDNALDNYVLHCAGWDTNINKLTKDASLRAANIQDIKEMRDHLPAYLNPYDKNKDKNNTEEITCEARNNHMRIYVGQSSPGAAYKTGRGHTAPINKSDEGPFTDNAKISIPSMITSGTTVRDLAAARGGFYYNGFTTTAGKINTPSGLYMYEILNEGFKFSEIIYDAHDSKDLMRMVTKNSGGGVNMVCITLSHKQLGYDDAWLKRKIIENRVKGEDADRDMFNRWTTGSLSSPLPIELNEAINNSKQDPHWVSYDTDGYLINWYVSRDALAEIKRTRKIVLGQDTSSAVGKDSIAMVFVDSWTGCVIGTAVINETNVYTYIGWVVELMKKESSIIIIPERRGGGNILMDGIIIGLISENINPLTRIYNTLVDSEGWMDSCNDVYRQSPQWWNSQTMNKVKQACGYATSGSGQHSRQNLYGNGLIRAAELSCDFVCDERLIREILGLVNRNGRVDHAISGHDDMVISWLLAFWMMLFSRNLSFYGITYPLRDAVEWTPDGSGKPTTVKEQWESDYTIQLREEFEEYMEKLRGTTCPYTQTALERIVRRLYDKIGAGSTGSSISTIDDLINNAKERVLRD